MRVFKLGLILLGLSLSAVLSADEVWDTNTGSVVYEAEMGPTAVWTYGTAENPGVIYLLGLAKVYENRGSYRGYWARNNSKKACDTQRPGVQGQMTAHWGQFDVTFLDKNFPSRWEARWTYCDEEEAQSPNVTATPVFGQANSNPRSQP